jgi:hypothetical protein
MKNSIHAPEDNPQEGVCGNPIAFMARLQILIPAPEGAVYCVTRCVEDGGCVRYPADPASMVTDAHTHLSCGLYVPQPNAAPGHFKKTRAEWRGMWSLVIDDVGSKGVTPGVEPTYKIETRPGSAHWVYVLDEPITDWDEASRLLRAVHAKGYGDPSGSNPGRLTRLPGSQPPGKSLASEVVMTGLRRFTEVELIRGMSLDLTGAQTPSGAGAAPMGRTLPDEVARLSADDVRDTCARQAWIEDNFVSGQRHAARLVLTVMAKKAGIPFELIRDEVADLNICDENGMSDLWACWTGAEGPPQFDAKDESGVEIGDHLLLAAKDVAERAQPERPPPSSRFFVTDDPGSLDDPWLLEGYLPLRGCGVMWAPPNTGKSFAAIDMCCHIASGIEQWAGLYVEHGSVYYCALEGGGAFKKRTSGWVRHKKPTPEQKAALERNMCVERMPVKLTEATAKQLVERIKGVFPGGVAMVVFDTLRRSMPGEENASEAFKAYMDGIEVLERDLDCCVLLIHHPTKTGKHASGSGTLQSNVDFEIQMEATKVAGKTQGTLTVLQQRDGETGLPVNFTLEGVHLGMTVKRKRWEGTAVFMAGVGAGAEASKGSKRFTEKDRMVKCVRCLIKAGTAPTRAATLAAYREDKGDPHVQNSIRTLNKCTAVGDLVFDGEFLAPAVPS